jgi:hypothetical protein
MSLTSQELKTAISRLPADERAELAQFLLRSLDEQDDEGARAEWLLGRAAHGGSPIWQGRGHPGGRGPEKPAGAERMKPVDFHPDAAEEAGETAAHYEGIRAWLGADFRAELDAALARIGNNPLIYAAESRAMRVCPPV